MAELVPEETDEEIYDFNLTAEQLEELEKQCQENRKLSILCGGPTGVGKSTLLNGMLGVDTFHVEHSLNRGTSKVEEKIINKGNIEICIWDTPGLEGVENVDDFFLAEIKEKCSKFDVFIYCIKSDAARATELFDRKSSLIKFNRLFGIKLWKRALIILTFANEVLADLEDDDLEPEEVETQFKAKMAEWKESIHRELQKNGVEEKKAKKVLVLPAGFGKLHLPGHQYWLSEIMDKALHIMKHEAKLSYLQLVQDRMRIKGEDEAIESSAAEMKPEDQPFFVSRKFKVASAVATSSVGVVGGVTGASIGATIGALLIGIPSFGIFAGGGLALGGVLGGAIGSGSAIALALAIRYFKKRQHKKKQKAIDNK